MPKFIENDDISGIQRLIQRLAAEEGISLYQLAERTGLHPTTLYSILRKSPGAHTRPIRRQTIKSLGAGFGYHVTFDAVKGKVIFERTDRVVRPKNDIDDLMDRIRLVLVQAGKRKMSKEEHYRIVRVVKAVVG